MKFALLALAILATQASSTSTKRDPNFSFVSTDPNVFEKDEFVVLENEEPFEVSEGIFVTGTDITDYVRESERNQGPSIDERRSWNIRERSELVEEPFVDGVRKEDEGFVRRPEYAQENEIYIPASMSQFETLSEFLNHPEANVPVKIFGGLTLANVVNDGLGVNYEVNEDVVRIPAGFKDFVERQAALPRFQFEGRYSARPQGSYSFGRPSYQHRRPVGYAPQRVRDHPYYHFFRKN